MAHAVPFLASAAAGYITGAVLSVFAVARAAFLGQVRVFKPVRPNEARLREDIERFFYRTG